MARAIEDAVYLDEDAYNQMIPMQQYSRTIEVPLSCSSPSVIIQGQINPTSAHILVQTPVSASTFPCLPGTFSWDYTASALTIKFTNTRTHLNLHASGGCSTLACPPQQCWMPACRSSNGRS